MNFDFFHIIGFIGMICVVFAYFLGQTGKLKNDDASYLNLNFFGSIFLLISLCKHFNLGSFIIEIFWIIITLYGFYKKYFIK